MRVSEHDTTRPLAKSHARARRLSRLLTGATLSAVLGLAAWSHGGAEAAGAAVTRREPAAAPLQDEGDAARAAQLFAEARALFENENWEAAATKFDAFVAAHPRDRNADAALYWLAVSLKKQGKFQEAAQAAARLMKEFPRSSWAGDARLMRVELASSTGDRPAVEEALGDADEDVRLVALQSLMRLEPARAMAYAADVLKEGSGASPRMKATVVTLLGSAGRGTATPLLIAVARGDSDRKLRRAAVYALGRAGDDAALDFLKGLAAAGGDEELAKAAVYAVAQLPGARVTELLGEVARAGVSKEARDSALNWLAQQDTEPAVAELLKTFDAAADEETKGLALLALGQSADRRAQARLAEVARAGAQPELRMHAILALGIRGEDAGLTALSALYDAEPDETVKEWVLTALGQAGQKRGLRKLMEVAGTDHSERMRRAALASLERAAGGDPAVERFLRERRK